jgi:hypothetical protein
MMQYYNAKIKHDYGTFKVKVYATDEKTGRHMICQAENCPDIAIVSIKPAQNKLPLKKNNNA